MGRGLGSAYSTGYDVTSDGCSVTPISYQRASPCKLRRSGEWYQGGARGADGTECIAGSVRGGVRYLGAGTRLRESGAVGGEAAKYGGAI